MKKRLHLPKPVLGCTLSLLLACSILGGHAARAAQQVEAFTAAAMKSGASAATAQSLAQALRTTIAERAKLTASGTAGLGYAVSLSGDRALVGAASFSHTIPSAAYVFVFDGSNWTLEGALTPPDETTNDTFGSAVSLSQDRAVVGAPYDTDSETPGAAYVFSFDGITWNEEATLTPTSRANFDQFGISVSLQGNRALVGANGQNRNTGAAYVFTRNGTSWSQRSEFTPPPNTDGGQFGISVSLSSRRALIGSLSGVGGFHGAAYVYAYAGATWSLQATLTASDNEAEDFFGYSVALSGDHALVGARYSTNFNGGAYVYAFDGTTWRFQQKLVASDGARNDDFGESVAIMGAHALIGAPEANDSMGAAYLFVLEGNTWAEQPKLAASDGAAQDQFGYSVSLSRQRALIGAQNADTGPGAAYVFGGH